LQKTQVAEIIQLAVRSSKELFDRFEVRIDLLFPAPQMPIILPTFPNNTSIRSNQTGR